MASDERPVWQDPLLSRPPVPTGTGSAAYVEQPEPRANPMTVEGEIAAFGDMARGAAHARGWRGTFARAFFGLVLVVFVAGLLFQLVVVLR